MLHLMSAVQRKSDNADSKITPTFLDDYGDDVEEGEKLETLSIRSIF